MPHARAEDTLYGVAEGAGLSLSMVPGRFAAASRSDVRTSIATHMLRRVNRQDAGICRGLESMPFQFQYLRFRSS